MDTEPLRKDLERQSEQTASGREMLQKSIDKKLAFMSQEERNQIKYLHRSKKPA